MQWQKSYEIEVSGLKPEQVWAVWTDINHWHEWDSDIDYARTDEPFQKGCRFVLKPKGGPKVRLEIVECKVLESYTDLTRFPLAHMYGHHEMKVLESGNLHLKTTMRLRGPLTFLWRKLVAQNIVNALPQDTANLIRIAKEKKFHG